jgi:hypothetical protein
MLFRHNNMNLHYPKQQPMTSKASRTLPIFNYENPQLYQFDLTSLSLNWSYCHNINSFNLLFYHLSSAN